MNISTQFHFRPVSIFWLTIVLILLSSPVYAADSAQDTDLCVDPVIHQFPVTSLGVDSPAAVFTLTNDNGAATRTFGTLSISGTNSDQFAIGTDNCSGQTIAANGGSCTVAVKFHPTRTGSKAANLLIPSDDSETSTLTAFMTNYEATEIEARRRMPAVLATASVPETMTASSGYPLTWTLEGYHDNYSSYAVMFDCTGIVDGSCGDNYGDANKFAESGVLTPASTGAGNWGYRGEAFTQQFNYSWNFTVPAIRADSSAWADSPGTEIVVRFYLKSDEDSERNLDSVSLLIPGNQSTNYYDTAGRRIVKRITP